MEFRGDKKTVIYEGDLEFQIIDWYTPENDKTVKHLENQERKINPEYRTEPTFEEYTIYLAGCTAKGDSVTVKVTGYKPHFYVKISETIDLSELQTEINDSFIESSTQFPGKYKDHIVPITVVEHKEFWGFTNGNRFPYLKVQAKSLGALNALKKWFMWKKRNPYMRGIKNGKKDKGNFRFYESNIEPFVRFIHEQNIDPCGWVKIKAETYDEVNNREEFRAQIVISVDAKNVKPLNYTKIAPLLIAGVDIECTSVKCTELDGTVTYPFPMPIKNYRQMAEDLINVAKSSNPLYKELNVTTVGKWIMNAFLFETKQGPINPVTTKLKRSEAKLSKLINVIIEEVVNLVIRARKSLTTFIDEDSDEEEEEKTNQTAQAIKKEILEAINSVLTGNLPPLEGDKITQIGTTVHRYGSDEILYKYIVTLNSCDTIEGATVECVDNEAELLRKWKEMFIKLDPDIRSGYNITGFDEWYIWCRTKELDMSEEFTNELGRVPNKKVALIEQRLSSSALGDNILKYLDIDGCVLIDMMKVMQRDHKLDSYKLDNVAKKFLDDSKNDVTPQEIFEKFLGTSADRCIIAKYCIQDCALVNRLIHKLRVLENNIGMGNVCSVPLSYLFMRGQGVKIFSLVAKECRNAGYVVPTFNSWENEDDESGYEGAIVLDPKEGIYLKDPIVVFDYSSLYPSSIIARNLSQDSYVMDEKYKIEAEKSGTKFVTVTYDIYEGDGDKKRKTGVKECTFAQPVNGNKAIMPNILEMLLSKRKQTRKKIEYETIVYQGSKTVSGLVSDKGETITVTDIDTKTVTTINRSDIVSRSETYTSFEQDVLDALQLAYKVTANSLYGQLGSKFSPIYCKEIAACTTATGREMIYIAKKFMEENGGAEVIYGDSVTGYTPVIIRHKTLIKFRTIESLAEEFGGSSWIPFRDNSKESCELVGVESWTETGWTKVHRVIRHTLAKKKQIIRVITNHGCVDVTDDHSLLTPELIEISPKEVIVGDELLHHRYPDINYIVSDLTVDDAKKLGERLLVVPDEVINGSQEVRESFWRASVNNDAMGDTDLSVASIVFLGESLGYFTENSSVKNRVEKLKQIDYSGYVYDLTTENHHFQAGTGKLIVHNTDSIFCKFPKQTAGLTGKEALEAAIKTGIKMADEIFKTLPPPQCLNYEKTLFPLILLGKKKYVGDLYETDANKKPKQKSMGIVLKRRDNAEILKTVYGGILDILMKTADFGASLKFLYKSLDELINGNVPLEQLIITKALRAEYKNPLSIAHKVLAERIGERNPGNKPAVNERIPFVYIIPPPNIIVKLQGDRIEHPDFIKENNLKPDYRFYISNQIMKPVSQLYALNIENLPGYNYPSNFWKDTEHEFITEGVLGKKLRDKITNMRRKITEDLLFGSVLEKLGAGVKVCKSVSKANKKVAATKKPSVNALTLTVKCIIDREEDSKCNKEKRKVYIKRYVATVTLQRVDKIVFEVIKRSFPIPRKSPKTEPEIEAMEFKTQLYAVRDTVNHFREIKEEAESSNGLKINCLNTKFKTFWKNCYERHVNNHEIGKEKKEIINSTDIEAQYAMFNEESLQPVLDMLAFVSQEFI